MSTTRPTPAKQRRAHGPAAPAGTQGGAASAPPGEEKFAGCVPGGPAASAADEAWGLMFALFQAEKARYFTSVAELGLSPMQAHALTQLEPDRPRAMSELADALHCDASNVTGIADRLEARGLVERRSAQHDRRVKTLAVTPAGAEARELVFRRMREAPRSIASLSPEDQDTLLAILRRALGVGDTSPR